MKCIIASETFWTLPGLPPFKWSEAAVELLLSRGEKLGQWDFSGSRGINRKLWIIFISRTIHFTPFYSENSPENSPSLLPHLFIKITIKIPNNIKTVRLFCWQNFRRKMAIWSKFEVWRIPTSKSHTHLEHKFRYMDFVVIIYAIDK